MVPQGPGAQEVFRQCGRCAAVLKQPEGEAARVAQRLARLR
jgi:ribosomal protein S27E